MNIDNITHNEAMKLIYTLVDKFGWKVSIVTDEEINYAWGCVTGEDIPDKEMAQIKDTYYWRKMEEYIWSEVLDGLHEAVLSRVAIANTTEKGEQ
jgi:hypothetical protein